LSSAISDEAEIETLFSRINALFLNKEYGIAADLLRGILQRYPESARALNALGAIACEKGAYSEAHDLLSQALHFDPANASICNSIGNVHNCEGDETKARAWFQRAVDCGADPAACYNVGLLDLKNGELESAASYFEQAAASQPDNFSVIFYLGVAKSKMGQYEEALTLFERAILLEPSRINAWMGAAEMHRIYNRSVEAEQLCRKGLMAVSDHAALLGSLGSALLAQGRITEAKQCFQDALARDPSLSDAYTCLMFALNYDPDASQEDIHALALAWDKACCASIPRNTVFANSCEPARPLRIGYVSADLHTHPVGFHLLPVLRNHDRSRFTVYCYYNSFTGDHITREFMELSDRWRIIAYRSDEEAAQLIREDEIDILVDLSGHTAHNRLQLFGRKPAPVQATWLGYFNTTGLSAIDYLITDDATVLAGEDQLFSEQVVRLPWSRFCFTPFANLPDPVAPPCLTSGRVTFGSFNTLAKVNPQVVAVWSRILRELPDSRLILKRGELSDPAMRRRFRELFAEHGIAESRLDLREASPYQQMLSEYGEVDIALDTFPFSGGLTTLDALLMGVPVVTLSGRLPISRQTRSFLRALNLLELVARNEERYVAIVCGLARDPARLEGLRGELRGRLMGSYLCDGKEFTANLERAYRTMWRTWCETAAPKAKRRRS
jgi:protein O-GlcNAc transferase